MVKPDSFLELEAPPGTYQRLSSIESGRLGNAYTKRFLTINDVPPDITGEPWLNIKLRVAESMARDAAYRGYVFAITEDDRVVNLRVTRFKIEANAQVEELSPPSFAEILKEIAAAERIQPSLKR